MTSIRRVIGVVAGVMVLAAGLVLGTAGTATTQVALGDELANCGLIREGRTGECVRMLQAALNRTGAPYNLTEDGQFGADTRIALLDFQGRNGLGADGNAGPQTLALLEHVSQVNAQGGGVVTPQPGEAIPPNKTQEWIEATPEERKCLDQWLLPDGNGGCVDHPSIGGVVPLGKSGPECAEDAVVGAIKSVIKEIRSGTDEFEAVKKVASKRAMPAAKIFKCVLWDQ